MAIVHQAGSTASDGEKLLIRELKASLPDDFHIYHNFEIPSSNGQFFEYDVVVVAPHAIYVIEDKYWHGEIAGNDAKITLGASIKNNPIGQVSRQAKILKSYLANKDPFLSSIWIEDVIHFSGRNVRISVKGNSKKKMHTLKSIKSFIQSPDKISGSVRNPAFTTKLQERALQLFSIFDPIRNNEKGFREFKVKDDKIAQTELYNEYIVYQPDIRSKPEFLLREFFMDPYLSGDDQKRQMHLIKNDYQTLYQLEDVKGIVQPKTGFVPDGDESRFCVVYPAPKGTPLVEWFLTDSQIGESKTRALFVQALNILKEVHKHGIIHRNLTSSNILVDSEDQLFLQNFEFSRVRDASTKSTIMTKTLAESLDDRYTPLRVRGDFSLANESSDLYSLARIFYDLLLGSDENTIETTNGLLPELPNVKDQELLRVIQKMGHDHSNQWYEYASEALEDLKKDETKPSSSSESVVDDKVIYEAGKDIEGRFLIEERLGQGGTSNVYKAFVIPRQESMAIKVMKRNVANENVALDEYHRLKTLDHPNIAKAYDVDSIYNGSQIVLKMEYIPGKSIQQLIDEGADFSITKVINWAKEILDALCYLQDRPEPIVHADIKPGNIMVNDGNIVLIDFNISRKQDDSRLLGATPRYSAPDVHTIGIDASIDTFSLGVLLYELLSNGEHPYQNGQPDLGVEPTPLTDYRKSISQELNSWIGKACASLKQDRFKSPKEMLDELNEIHKIFKDVKITEPKIDLKNITPLSPSINKNYCNHLIPYYQSLYSQSAISNKGTRGLDRFAEANYIDTRLDQKLRQSIIDGKYQLVIITGNAGDGKTAFIQRLENILLKNGGKITAEKGNGKEIEFQQVKLITNYDGSQDEGEVLNKKVLEDFFQPFTTDNAFEQSFEDKKEVRLIAINEGRLMEFLDDSKYHHLFQTVEGYLRKRVNDVGEFALVNLNWRSVVARTEEEPSIVEKLMNQFADLNVIKDCDVCTDEFICPTCFNIKTLNDETIGPQVKENIRRVFELVHLRKKFHITMRDIRSALSYIIYGSKSSKEMKQLMKDGSLKSLQEISNMYYYNSMFNAGNSSDRLMKELQDIDVSKVAIPQIEKKLSQTSSSDQKMYATKDFDGVEKEANVLDAFYKQKPLEQEQLTNLYRVKQFKHFVQMSKRKYFFESLNQDSRLPYPSFKRFSKLFEDNEDLVEVRDQILQAISFTEGILKPLKGSLSLRESKWRTEDLLSMRVYPKDDFKLEMLTLGDGFDFIEYEPDAFKLVYKPNKRISFEVTLDLYELFHKVNQGYVPTAYELRGAFMNLSIFKRQLLSQRYEEIILSDHTGRYIAKKDGKKLVLVTIEEGGSEQ
ncbi:protein kinase [Halobacillus litoralis]|uniref:protein kinase domain-containing protein n=1 Tax=Halobacillus litoralis TaxID=45668 RepID=UPI001CFD9EEB|nr:protein kinase [Halobacillus litoralis]WLR46563.1 protein kinase [Halobacillus litoralis]